MAKKLFIILFILATLAVVALNLLSRKAPDFLRHSIERALNKAVLIESIEYRFPWGFDLKGFEIQEKEPFAGERSFAVNHVRLELSPLSFSSKKLIIDKIKVEDADIIIRKYRGKLFHALSGAMKSAPSGEGASSQGASARTGASQALPLEIHKFDLEGSRFKFIDYDVDEKGFVISFDSIAAKIRDIRLPFTDDRTEYDLSARLLQGRNQKAAVMSMTGWTQFASVETDANLRMMGVFLPYFRPYYGQVTKATIEDGYVDAHANVRIANKDLTASVDLEMIGLLFQSYEEENQLFGLKADEILSFLKDRSGRLKFQIEIRWNMADRSVHLRDVIRKSIERSLKSTVLGNIGNILQKTIERISEKGGFERAKENESLLNKIKSFLK